MLNSERIILRRYHENDFPCISLMLCDKRVMRDFGTVMDLDGARNYFDRRLAESLEQQPDVWHFIAALKPDDTPVGEFSLFPVKDDSFRPDCAVVGYRISPVYWNQGYATEALKLLLVFAFEELKLHKVSSGTTTDNYASQRVMEKAGMRREGCMKQHSYFDGKWHDMFEYGIINSL